MGVRAKVRCLGRGWDALDDEDGSARVAAGQQLQVAFDPSDEEHGKSSSHPVETTAPGAESSEQGPRLDHLAQAQAHGNKTSRNDDQAQAPVPALQDAAGSQN